MIKYSIISGVFFVVVSGMFNMLFSIQVSDIHVAFQFLFYFGFNAISYLTINFIARKVVKSKVDKIDYNWMYLQIITSVVVVSILLNKVDFNYLIYSGVIWLGLKIYKDYIDKPLKEVE